MIRTHRFRLFPPLVAFIAAVRLKLAVCPAFTPQARAKVARAVEMSLSHVGPDIEQDRDPATGIPRFILRA